MEHQRSLDDIARRSGKCALLVGVLLKKWPGPLSIEVDGIDHDDNGQIVNRTAVQQITKLSIGSLLNVRVDLLHRGLFLVDKVQFFGNGIEFRFQSGHELGPRRESNRIKDTILVK